MPAQLLGDVSVNGIPGAPSGSLRFYQPTTLIPVTVYSNDAATSAITQPIALDANGRSATPIYVTKMVRMIVYDVNGAQLQDVERSDGERAETVSLVNTSWPLAATEDAAWTLLATSLGTTNGSFKASGVGSVARTVQGKLSEQLSLKDFGAKGDGVTDDTGAITAALAAASLLGGATVAIPAGTYIVASAITVGSNITLQGQGRTASVLKNTGTAASVFSLPGSTGVTFDGFSISHQSTSTAAAIAITSTADSILISRLSISGHRTGISQANVATGYMTIRETDILCDNNAASVCLQNGSFVTTIFGGSMDTGIGALGSAVSVTAGSIVAFSGRYRAATGFLTTLGQITIFGCIATQSGVLYAASGGARVLNFGGNSSNFITGTPSVLYIDPTTGSWGDTTGMVSTSIGTTSAYTPQFTQYGAHKVTGTVGGITITINNTPGGSAYPGTRLHFILANNSGGAVAWTFSAAYRAAAVAPATGFQTGIVFAFDGTFWIEESRSGTVPI